MVTSAESARRRQAPLSLRHPRWLLGAAILAIAALGVLGTGVESRLTPTSLSVAGTPSAEGTDLLEEHFGDSAPFAVLLRGPAAAIERQGPALIRELREDPRVTTLSPWDGRALGRLRPAPDRALVLVDFHVGSAAAVDDAVKTDCIAKAADDKAKAALCPCAGAVTVQYWMSDPFMREQVEAYLKSPTPKGVTELLKYQGPQLYQICEAAK